MLVLGKGVKERIRRDAGADILEGDTRLLPALHPEIDGWNLVAAADDGVAEVELAIELEGPRVNGECAGGGAGSGGLVDDSDLYSKLRQPERKHEAGGTGADDKDIAASHDFFQ